jgi:hypothetical protein
VIPEFAAFRRAAVSLGVVARHSLRPD